MLNLFVLMPHVSFHLPLLRKPTSKFRIFFFFTFQNLNLQSCWQRDVRMSFLNILINKTSLIKPSDLLLIMCQWSQLQILDNNCLCLIISSCWSGSSPLLWELYSSQDRGIQLLTCSIRREGKFNKDKICIKKKL